MVNTFVPDIRDGQRELYESNESKATYFSYNFRIIFLSSAFLVRENKELKKKEGCPTKILSRDGGTKILIGNNQKA